MHFELLHSPLGFRRGRGDRNAFEIEAEAAAKVAGKAGVCENGSSAIIVQCSDRITHCENEVTFSDRSYAHCCVYRYVHPQSIDCINVHIGSSTCGWTTPAASW